MNNAELKAAVKNGGIAAVRTATPLGVGVLLWYLVQIDHKLDQVIDLLLRVLGKP